jgi:hypothetical protein
MTSYISASSPSGNGRRIILYGIDLISGNIENVFVYPTLDVNRFRDALSHTLSHWPILTGHLIIDNNDQHLIECCDKSIPLTYTENDQLKCWPDLPVVIDDMTILQPFIDSVQHKPERESLVRFKITHLVLSGEYVLGTSFYHMIGDANTKIRFLNDLSRIYQHFEPVLPRPIFERQLLKNENLDYSLPNIIDLSKNAGNREILLDCLTKEHSETDPINMSFSSEQLIQLHNLIENNDEITTHDALCAYIILTLNKHFFSTTDEYIRHVRMIVNYRGVCNRLAPIGYVGNSLITTIPSEFSNPLSLSNIAKIIRQSIKSIRNEDLIEKYVTSADVLCRQLIKDNRINFIFGSKEFIFNSNLKYDWTNEVNFGMINQCRFHTVALYKFYFRIFQLNPIKNQDGIWIKDNGGAEIAFRIPKGQGKETFLAAWKKDIEQKFVNVC